MALPFTGKHCAIVGATGIIGSSIARAFASKGAVLTLLSRSVQQQPRLQDQFPSYQPPAEASKHLPREHRSIPLDILHTKSIGDVFAKAVPEGEEQIVGPVDILINCAGISQTTLFKRTSDDALKTIIDTNLMATMLACKHAKMQPRGCIINISSLMATKGAVGATAYAASKAAVVGFSRALCLELAARGIRVNALLPGWVESPMWDDLLPHLKEAYIKDTPLKRVATPDEVADAAIFLASNKFANNCVLNLDGGLSAV